jgi:ABC-type lipoprotein release transport system permease subunit
MQSALYGVSAHERFAIGTGVIVLTTAAFVACLLPALRAARIEPTTALRAE